MGSGCTRVARSRRSRSSRMPGCVRSCGSTYPPRTARPRARRSTPRRSRPIPSGPTYPSESSHAAGSSSRVEDSLREPVAVQVHGLLRRLGQRQVDDVERAAREELLALLAADCVVGRCDEIDERTGRAGVTDGAKRLQVAHRGERTNALQP